MSQNYIFYSNQISMKPDSAHEIHDVMCANAAANLGYSSILIYPNYHNYSNNLFAWLNTYKPDYPKPEFVDFYNVQNKLKTIELPIPKFTQKIKNKLINSSRFIYQYYLPYHIFPNTKAVHTRDWNCVKSAVKSKVPVIYERHYFQETPLDKTITDSPYFKIAIAQSPLIQQSLIDAGIPTQKTTWMHNAFSPTFLERRAEEAQNWRKELLKDGRQYLVIYSGALYKFKGIDLLIDVAKELPNIQFALTGGTDEQVQAYRQLAADKQVNNIDFLGWILPRSRLVSILQAADILAHPHCSGKSADFTNPVKFFQYIAAGTPMVVTEIEPLKEFKSSPMIATWCEPDNPSAFAQAILRTLEQYPRKDSGYGENIEYSRQFTWEKRTEKFLNYLNN
jgi:glycosyltransferase involved in cell wall biosynthesis